MKDSELRKMSVYRIPETNLLSVDSIGYIPDSLDDRIIPYIVRECKELGETCFPIHVDCLASMGYPKLQIKIKNTQVGYVTLEEGFYVSKITENFCSMGQMRDKSEAGF